MISVGTAEVFVDQEQETFWIEKLSRSPLRTPVDEISHTRILSSW